MLLKQAERQIAVSSPLGEDVLLFRAMTASESLGRLSCFDLDLLSENHEIKLEDVLGQNLTVRLELPQDGGTRYFNGFASQFSYEGWSGDLARYRAQLRPWPWFLTRTADSRIFQEMTVPDIIEKVFRDQGFSDFEKRLSGEYRTWTYCVQYRETDFNFVSRMMELEGIYYYFKHQDGKHDMILADSESAHEPEAGYETVPFYPPDQKAIRERDHISQWSISQDVQSGAYMMRDFDFKRPKADLSAVLSTPFSHQHADYEVYDYPGAYYNSGDGDNYVKVRLEELHGQYERAEGGGDAAGLCAGNLVTLDNYPREDQNKEYLLLSTAIELESDDYETTAGAGEGTSFYCSFTAIDAKQPYRAPRVTPKPMVQGPQTAVVTGPGGEEIYTDEHGRVKVQFHWDREGQNDENTSCWIRVSQPWAGKNWGGVAIPRIGQEVIVDFLEGDPDQPIITGRVYNGEAVPPYALPANMTQTGIKSRSSKGGTGDNFNEIRFEDKKGSEEVYVHAEKDMNRVVENNDTLKVGFEKADAGDQTIGIKNDRTEEVGHDEKITIGNDRTEEVGNDEKITIGNDRTEDVGNNETITIGVNRTEKVGANEQITIGGNRTEDVGGNEKITIGGNRTEKVAANQSVTISGNSTDTISGNETRSITGTVSETIAGSMSQTITGGATITTPAAITITAQGGFTVVAPGGTRTVDSFFDSMGGVDSNTFGMTKSACMVAINLIGGLELSSKNVVVEGVTAKAEDVYMAYALKVLDTSTTAIKIENDSLDMKWGALHIIS